MTERKIFSIFATGKMARAAFGAVALALLAGCSFIPAYERPAAPVPEHFDGVTETAATPLSPWRDYYTNPSLQVLIEAALDHNRDLTIALARVDEARAPGRHRPRRALPHAGSASLGQPFAPAGGPLGYRPTGRHQPL